MNLELAAFSDSLASLVKAAAPSVVRVEARHGPPGSGIVFSADGLVVTASHVVEEEDIELGLEGGAAVRATLVGRDPTTDLVLLRAEAKDLVVAAWDDGAELAVGQLALSVMRPGKSARASLGVVNALGTESWRAPTGGRIDRYLETDIGLRRGFSGSLLLSAKGAAVGMNTAGLLRASAVAVVPSTIRRVAAALVEHGEVRRGWLGIGSQPARLPDGAAKDLGQPGGLLVVGVEKDSPADKAGILLGDVILAFDGVALRHPSDLLALLDEGRIGKDTPVKLLRGGKVEEKTITALARPRREA